MALPPAVAAVVEEASGRGHRGDPVLPRAGGPAGGARLTAWLGLVLLVLFLAQLVTLFDVRGLITWHLALGLLLVPPSLAKTATTGWRVVRYYRGSPAYRSAGPPPTLLRLLGPLVVAGTLAVLGTGIALVVLGPERDHGTLVSVLGQQVSALTLHQVAFSGWAAVTALHLLGRLLPALLLLAPAGRVVPGRALRAGALALTAGAAGLVCVVVLGLSGSWTGGDLHEHGGPGDGRVEGGSQR